MGVSLRKCTFRTEKCPTVSGSGGTKSVSGRTFKGREGHRWVGKDTGKR